MSKSSENILTFEQRVKKVDKGVEELLKKHNLKIKINLMANNEFTEQNKDKISCQCSISFIE